MPSKKIVPSEKTLVSSEKKAGPSAVRRVRSVLTGRRLLVGLLVLLLVPASLGLAALSYEKPEPAPVATAPDHAPLPQVPDSVARAQLDRGSAMSRLAKKQDVPMLRAALKTGPQATWSLPTLTVPPRAAVYSIPELRALFPVAFSALPGGALLVNANIVVPAGATLLLDGRTPDIRLASSPAGFATIISRGTVTVKGTAKVPVAVTSWDPKRAAPDDDIVDGRAFVLQVGGRMDIDQGRFSYLGFGTGTSSGVAWNGSSGTTAAERVKAQGVVTASEFTHNHFGAYTHEAVGMRWETNTFADNAEYGFDPHDYSNNFLVAGNSAHHNGKHGFIFSRGCDGNILRDNTAYANAGHGFMIDDGRSAASTDAEMRLDPSNDNIVTDNTAYDNANSGVEIEGGTGNVVSGNRLERNDIGVRIKDRASAAVLGNVISNSNRYGVNVINSSTATSVTGNEITGSWAAVNLSEDSVAALGTNPSTDVSTPLVVAGVAVHESTWSEDVIRYLRWNPLLVLWSLILGLPALMGVLRFVRRPFLHIHRPGYST